VNQQIGSKSKKVFTISHPTLDAPHFLKEKRHEFFVDGIVYEDPGSGNTGLARRDKSSKGSTVDGADQVCIVKYQDGCLR